jgi:hypothetical protein
MSDPRNVAHAKKVKQEKEHQQPAGGAEAKPRKKRKTDTQAAPKPAPAAEPKAEQPPVDHEKSVTVLSKLKDMEFHSRANIETLAGLILTVEEELKQKEFSDPLGEIYAAQDSFHSKIAALIESYEAKVESLKPL